MKLPLRAWLCSFLFALLFFALAPSSPLHAASAANGGLAGIVLDAHGNPVAHASVTMQTSYGQHPHATYTDRAGHFSFTRYSRGQYDLRAGSRGAYSNWMKRVLIRPGKTTQVTLRLKD